MFQLTNEGTKNLMFQNGTSSLGEMRKAPYIFTEQGVAMLSGILNSDRAIEMNIQIMRIFTIIPQMSVDNTEKRLEIIKSKNMLENQYKNMKIIILNLDELLQKQEQPKPFGKRIGHC
jgi:hypothetical protein